MSSVRISQAHGLGFRSAYGQQQSIKTAVISPVDSLRFE